MPLHVILTNQNNFYSPPLSLASIGWELSFVLPRIPSFSSNHTSSVAYGSFRSLQNNGLQSFGTWLSTEDRSYIYNLHDLDEKITAFHKKLNDKYLISFTENFF